MRFHPNTEKPEPFSKVICKSVHGLYYAALFIETEFYPYAHLASDVPIGEVESWAYQHELESSQ